MKKEKCCLPKERSGKQDTELAWCQANQHAMSGDREL